MPLGISSWREAVSFPSATSLSQEEMKKEQGGERTLFTGSLGTSPRPLGGPRENVESGSLLRDPKVPSLPPSSPDTPCRSGSVRVPYGVKGGGLGRRSGRGMQGKSEAQRVRERPTELGSRGREKW